jgi:hypothetical protein
MRLGELACCRAPADVRGITQRFLRPGHKFLDLVGDDRMQASRRRSG